MVSGLFSDITIHFTEITSTKLLKSEQHIVQSNCTYFPNICSYILQPMMDTLHLWFHCICMLWTLKLLMYSYIYVNILIVFGKTTIFGAAKVGVCTSLDYLGDIHGPCSTAVIFCLCVLLQHTMAAKLGTKRIENVCLSNIRIILWPGFTSYICICICIYYLPFDPYRIQYPWIWKQSISLIIKTTLTIIMIYEI